MVTGRDWTRKSIEELIEAKLKKIKLPTPPIPPIGGSQAFNCEISTYSGLANSQFAIASVADISTDITLAGEFDGISGNYPVNTNSKITSQKAIFWHFRAAITDSDINDNIDTKTYNLIDQFTGRVMNYGWAYKLANPKKLYRLKVGTDYNIRTALYTGLSRVFAYSSETVTIAGQSRSVPYTYIYDKADVKTIRDKVNTVVGASGSTYIILSNVLLDDASMISFIQDVIWATNFTSPTVEDLDIS